MNNYVCIPRIKLTCITKKKMDYKRSVKEKKSNIVRDNKTKQGSYKIGDVLEDMTHPG